MAHNSILSRLRTVLNRISYRVFSAKKLGYISGGHQNVGDKFLYQAAERLFGHLVPMTSAGEEKKLKVLCLSGPKLFQGVLLGGGTLINSYMYELCSVLLSMNLPMVTLGTGAGSGGHDQPVDEDISGWKPLLNRFRFMGVRGPLSQRRLESLGVRNVEVVGDLGLVFAVDTPSRIKTTSRLFAINVLPPHGFASYDQHTLNQIAEVCSHLVQQGWNAIPIAHHPLDVSTLKAMMDRGSLPRGPIHLPSTISELLSLLSPCQVMLSMRLHGSVFACCAGVPPVLLGYSDKCVDFAESMGLLDFHHSVNSFDSDAVLGLVEKVIHEGEDLRHTIRQRATAYRERLIDYTERVQIALNVPRRKD